jgi:hypothetical protein
MAGRRSEEVLVANITTPDKYSIGLPVAQINIPVVAFFFYSIFRLFCSSLVYSLNAEEKFTVLNTFRREFMRKMASFANSGRFDINM